MLMNTFYTLFFFLRYIIVPISINKGEISLAKRNTSLQISSNGKLSD